MTSRIPDAPMGFAVVRRNSARSSYGRRAASVSASPRRAASSTRSCEASGRWCGRQNPYRTSAAGLALVQLSQEVGGLGAVWVEAGGLLEAAAGASLVALVQQAPAVFDVGGV